MPVDLEILRNALQKAFPDREDLDGFLTFRCGESLEAWTGNAGTDTQYLNILKEKLDPRGLTIRFFWRAWFYRPGNKPLLDAIREVFKVLPEVIPDALLDLHKIVEADTELCAQTNQLAPGFWQNRGLRQYALGLTGDFTNSKDHAYYEYAEILGTLACTELKGAGVGLFVFVGELEQRLRKGGSDGKADKLAQWLKDYAPQMQPVVLPAPAGNLHPVLMIQILEMAQGVCTISAFSSIRSEPPSPVPLDNIGKSKKKNEKDIDFNAVPIAELPRVVDKLCRWFNRVVLREPDAQGLDDTLFEFILPIGLIEQLPVEDWTSEGAGRLPERWSERYRLCVRPYERLRVTVEDSDDDYFLAFRDWKLRWSDFDAKRSLHPVVVDDECSAEDIDHVLSDMAATCVLRRCSGVSGAPEPVNACVGRGFGVVLWIRSPGLSRVEVETALGPLVGAGRNLLDEARNLRKGSATHRKLVVLWDDPSRVPPVLDDLSVD